MTESFERLIHVPEPLPLVALHAVKLIVLLAPICLLMALVGPLIGTGSAIWIYLMLIFLTAGIGSALLANKWSESLFVRRAEAEGLDTSEAREFLRTYDWDEVDD